MTVASGEADPWQKKILKRLMHEEEFQQFAARHSHLKGLDTVEQILEHLNIHCAIPVHCLEQIPEHGPLVIIANHPTGTLDGLALLYAVSRVRRDVKVVTNRMLNHLEPLKSLFIPVDNINGRTAKSALQKMDSQLQSGGVLIFFLLAKSRGSPVAVFAIKNGTPALLNWPPNIAHRCCLIDARNSALFYASALMSPNLPRFLSSLKYPARRSAPSKRFPQINSDPELFVLSSCWHPLFRNFFYDITKSFVNHYICFVNLNNYTIKNVW